MTTLFRTGPSLESISTDAIDLNEAIPVSEKPGYRRGAKLIASAARDFGVELSSDDVKHFIVMHGVMRALDQRVDDQGVDDVNTDVNRLINGETIEGVTQDEASAFAESFSTHSPSRQDNLRELLVQVAPYARQRRQAVTVGELMAVNEAEANNVYAPILELDVDEFRHSDIEERQRFNEWLHTLSMIGYMFDSASDIRKDHVAGNLHKDFEPDTAARLRILKIVVPEALRAIGETPPRTTLRLARVAFMMNVFERKH